MTAVLFAFEAGQPANCLRLCDGSEMRLDDGRDRTAQIRSDVTFRAPSGNCVAQHLPEDDARPLRRIDGTAVLYASQRRQQLRWRNGRNGPCA